MAIDNAIGIMKRKPPFFACFIKPVIVASCFATVRQNFFALVKDLRDSIIIIFSILIYVLLYSQFVYAICQGSNEYMFFWERIESFYNMLILLTTANFPDIMLPSYERHWIYSFFFINFLLIALYLFLNILLANFYSKFQ